MPRTAALPAHGIRARKITSVKTPFSYQPDHSFACDYVHHPETLIMNDKSWMFRAAATEVPQPRLTEQAERDAFEPYAPLEAGRTAEPATFLSADLIAPVAMTRDHDGGAINPNAFAIPAAQHDAHLFRVALVGCAVFAGLGLGLTSGFNWSSFLGNEFRSCPTGHPYGRTSFCWQQWGGDRESIGNSKNCRCYADFNWARSRVVASGLFKYRI